MDRNAKADAWWRLKARLAAHGPAAGLPMPSYCAAPVMIGIDLAADDSGGFTPEPLFRDGRPTLRFIEDMLGPGSTHDAGAKGRAFGN